MSARPSAALAALVTGVLALSSCALHTAPRDGAAPPRPVASRSGARIAQLGYGQDAHYSICAAPACPLTTVKTLASPAADPAGPDATLGSGAGTATMPVTQAAESTEQLIVFFAPGAVVPDATARRAIDRFVAGARPATRIVVAGRTDDRGSRQRNEALARARATNVKRYLAAKLPALAIEVDARGACCYLAGNETAAGRRDNRRVELSFVDDQPGAAHGPR